jgi:hypothetical protein
VPASPAIEAFLREQAPDLLLVTPLIELGSQQVDYVKCARRLGIRSVLCVASWDNLTSKGLIRVVPDRVVVWNEAQKQEAVTLHGVAPARVVVTGAQLFDPWFAATPERSREAFCAAVGLDPARPFVLYVGSSSFIAPDEVPFAERWLAHLRGAADPRVSGLGVLLRPHPANSRQWRALDLEAQQDAALWPPIGSDPNGEHFRRDFFESLYYSAAVVGINTSAQIEAAIVGRPVFTVRAPEFAHAQEGTLHFQHLVDPQSGFVREAHTLDEHIAQLTTALDGRAGAEAIDRHFVGAFVRPLGIDRPVAPLFAGAVGQMLADAPEPARGDARWVRVVRPLAYVLARLVRPLADDRPLWAHVMRPLVTMLVWIAAAGYVMNGVWNRHGRPRARRAGRALWRAWYETSLDVRARARRGRRSLARLGRRVAGALRRVVRRQRAVPVEAGRKNA